MTWVFLWQAGQTRILGGSLPGSSHFRSWRTSTRSSTLWPYFTISLLFLLVWKIVRIIDIENWSLIQLASWVCIFETELVFLLILLMGSLYICQAKIKNWVYSQVYLIAKAVVNQTTIRIRPRRAEIMEVTLSFCTDMKNHPLTCCNHVH
jgi:hypothetical protein